MRVIHVVPDSKDGLRPAKTRCGRKSADLAASDVCASSSVAAVRREMKEDDGLNSNRLGKATFCTKCVAGLALFLALSLCGCAGIPVRDVAAASGSVAGSLTPEPIAAIVAPIVAPVAKAAEELARQREEQGKAGLWTTILAVVGAAGSGFVAARGRRTTSHVDELYDETKQLGAKVAALQSRPGGSP